MTRKVEFDGGRIPTESIGGTTDQRLQLRNGIWLADDNGSFYRMNQDMDVIKKRSHVNNFAGGAGVEGECIWHARPSEVIKYDQSANIQKSFRTSLSRPLGVGVDGSNCVWVSDEEDAKAVKFDQSGNVQKSFSTPGPEPEGLGLEPGNDCIWIADFDKADIYELDHSGNVQKSFAAPSNSPKGLAVDSNACLWEADEAKGSGAITLLDQSGSASSSFTTPEGFNQLNGAGIDSSGCVWISTTDLTLYETDQSGNTKGSISLQKGFPRGISNEDSSGSLWRVTRQMIQKTDTGGSEVDSLNPASHIPTGIAQTSENLWIAERQGNTIQKYKKAANPYPELESVSVPDSNVRGLGIDSNDCLWTVGGNSVYKAQSAGGDTASSQFQIPSGEAAGIAVDDYTGCIWYSDKANNCIYKTDQSGNIEEKYDAPSDAPRGLGV